MRCKVSGLSLHNKHAPLSLQQSPNSKSIDSVAVGGKSHSDDTNMDLQNQDPSFDTQYNRRKRQSPLSISDDNEEYDATNLPQQQHHPTKTRRLLPIPSSFEYNIHPNLDHESDTVLAPLIAATNHNMKRSIPTEETIIITVTQNNTVEERVRARSLLLQQSGSNTSSASHTSKTTTANTNSTLDPQFIIHVTDAMWSYLITTNFRQQQQQMQQQKHHRSSHQKESGTIENKATNLFVATTTTRKGMNQNQNLILKDVVNELRRTMQAKSFGKSVNKMNMTLGIQGMTSTTTTGSNSNSVTKREIVHALLELHTNPIYSQWVTLLDPNTMLRVRLLPVVPIGDTVGVTNNGNDDIPPNTIVQIDHSIPYQSIRKHLLSLL